MQSSGFNPLLILYWWAVRRGDTPDFHANHCCLVSEKVLRNVLIFWVHV